MGVLDRLRFGKQVRVALDAYEVGHWEKAIEELNKALEISPARDLSAGVHGSLADCYIGLEKWDLALHHARESVRLTPKRTEPRMALAAVYQKLGRWEHAELELTTVLSFNPRLFEARVALAGACRKQKKFDAAIDQLRQGLLQSRDPQERAVLYQLLLTVHKERGGTQEALAAAYEYRKAPRLGRREALALDLLVDRLEEADEGPSSEKDAGGEAMTEPLDNARADREDAENKAADAEARGRRFVEELMEAKRKDDAYDQHMDNLMRREMQALKMVMWSIEEKSGYLENPFGLCRWKGKLEKVTKNMKNALDRAPEPAHPSLKKRLEYDLKMAEKLLEMVRLIENGCASKDLAALRKAIWCMHDTGVLMEHSLDAFDEYTRDVMGYSIKKMIGG